MQIAVSFSLLLITLILQFTLIPLFSIKGVTPNLVIIVVISIAFRNDQTLGIAAGFFAGLIFDIFGTGFVGVSALAYSISAFIVGFLASEQLQKRFSIIFGLLFFALLVQNTIYFSIMAIGTASSFGSTWLGQAVPHTFYTMVFILIVHLLMPKALWGLMPRN